jgi:hypothetical protein
MIISIEGHDVSDVVVAYVSTPYDAITHLKLIETYDAITHNMDHEDVGRLVSPSRPRCDYFVLIQNIFMMPNTKSFV